MYILIYLDEGGAIFLYTRRSLDPILIYMYIYRSINFKTNECIQNNVLYRRINIICTDCDKKC